MDKKLKRSLMALIAFGVVLYAVVTNVETAWRFVLSVGKLVLPIIIGLVIAFVLNVPMKAFERLYWRMFSKAKRKPHTKMIYLMSLVSAIL